LDTKLVNCDFCLTISEFNRTHLMLQFPNIPPAKIIVQHLGVDIADPLLPSPELPPSCVVLLAIGRLHAVKDHAFLINACARLRDRGTDVLCLIAGEGPERDSLEHQIATLGLEGRITLLGHVPHEELEAHYARADVGVLTSRSEGIPLVLMEAMMRGKVVLAPDITGIPELVENGRTGFLYQPGSLDQFVAQIERLQLAAPYLQRVRVQARAQVLAHFERTTNLEMFADRFLAHIRQPSTTVYENPLLQQI
jgi:glycosyltransferase involved in cell wall biosynthesis